ncbi:MAG: HlyD family secretion protein [Gammaproteobacteria bacterium]
MSVHNEQSNARVARAGGPSGYLKLAVVVVLAVAALVWLAQWIQYRRNHVSGDDARVKTAEVTVSSRVPGRVLEFSHIGGDHLKQSAVVARLYSRPQKLKLQELKDRVAGIQAELDYQEQDMALTGHQLEGGIEEAKRLLDTDQAAMQAAKAGLEQARKTFQRSERLFRKHMVSDQQRDLDYYHLLAAQADYQRANRQVKMDRTSLTNARGGLLTNPQMALPTRDLLKAKLVVTRKKLAEARAALQREQVQLDDRVVRSPLDGVVDKTFIQPGEYVSAGQPILMMHAPDDVWVEANIKETEVDELREGQPVHIHVDAYPDQTFRGHVRVIGHAATSQFALLPDPNPSGNFTKITQRIPVRITIDKGPKARLSPGMMVEVDVDVSNRQKGG